MNQEKKINQVFKAALFSATLLLSRNLNSEDQAPSVDVPNKELAGGLPTKELNLMQEIKSAAERVNSAENRMRESEKSKQSQIAIAAAGGFAAGATLVGLHAGVNEAKNHYSSKTLGDVAKNCIKMIEGFYLEQDAEGRTTVHKLENPPILQRNKLTNTQFLLFKGAPNGDWKFVVESFELIDGRFVKSSNPWPNRAALKIKYDKTTGSATAGSSFYTYFKPKENSTGVFYVNKKTTPSKLAITPWFKNKKNGKFYSLILANAGETTESVASIYTPAN